VSRLPRRHAERPVDIAAGTLLRRLRLSLLLLGMVIVYGTVGYFLLERMTPLDSLYQTVITISTVGFKEVHDLHDFGKLFTITLILGGTGVSLYTLGLAFELLLSEQFNHWRQRQKMQRNIDQMREHYLICGWGRIGKQV